MLMTKFKKGNELNASGTIPLCCEKLFLPQGEIHHHYCLLLTCFFFYLIHYQFYTASQLWANKVNQLNRRHRCWLCNGTIFSWQMTSKQINYQHNIVCDRHEYISSFQLVYFILKLKNFLGGFWFKHQNWVEMKTIPKEHERVCVL